jgi:hypothetical protein
MIPLNTKPRTKTFDPKCYDVAEFFLEDHPHLNTTKRATELAVLIAETIQDYIDSEEDNYDGPDVPGFEGGFADNH